MNLCFDYLCFLFLGSVLCSAYQHGEDMRDARWPPPMGGYKHEVFSIPWPSGILVRPVMTRNGIERVVILEHSAISVRPQWDEVHIVPDILSPAACQDIIDEAEAYAMQHGWMTARHADYPTTDLPLSSTLSNYSAFKAHLAHSILPALASEYSLDLSRLRIQDLFIAKYDASQGQRHLEYHRDRNTWSFILPLNSEYNGGGTHFYHQQRTWKPPVGSAVIFNGKLWHAGLETTSGVRYIVAGFCEYGDTADNLVASSYIPEYDGYAAKEGVRSGDIIRGIGVCSQGESGDVLTSLRPVTPAMSPEEWYEAAVSCEQLAPMSSTLMVMERQCDDIDQADSCVGI